MAPRPPYCVLLAIGIVAAAGCRCDPSHPRADPVEPTLRPRGGSFTATPTASANRSLGMGLGQMVEWSPQFAFLDLVKQARPWEMHRSGGAWGKGGRPVTDAHGWLTSLEPGQRARLLLSVGLDHVPFDRFVVRYRGEGRIVYEGNARRVDDGPDGWNDLVQLMRSDQPHFFSLVIESTDPAEPIRDIQVVPERFRAHHEAGERFNPMWLDRIRPFGALRFMDWMHTNDSYQRRWATRPLPADMTWRPHGVPAEIMVELANVLDADPWFNVPHRADDDWVRRFATLVRQQLEPGRTAWFEHSNEVWNLGFGQARYARAQGAYRFRDRGALKAGLTSLRRGDPQPDLSSLVKSKVAFDLEDVAKDVATAGLDKELGQVLARGLDRDRVLEHLLTHMIRAAPPTAAMQYQGVRTAQICDVVKGEVFRTDPDRVRCVVGTLTSWRGAEQAALLCPDWAHAPCKAHGIDAIAINGYLRGSVSVEANAPVLRKWSRQGEAGVRALIAELAGAATLPVHGDALPRVLDDFAYHARAAKEFGIQLVVYEGGQHVAANHAPALRDDPEIQKLYLAANRHPAMGPLYRRLLDGWKAAGGTRFMHYVDVTSYGRYGCWGALERLDEGNPKYDALAEWSRSHPEWW